MLVKIQGPNLRDQSKGQFHVHAADCSDNGKYEENGWIKPVSMDSRLACESYIYDFAPDETPGYELGDYQFDFHFAPCVKGLPMGDE